MIPKKPIKTELLIDAGFEDRLSFKKHTNENHFHCLRHSPHFGNDFGKSGLNQRMYTFNAETVRQE